MTTARERSNANYDSALAGIEATTGMRLNEASVTLALTQVRATLALVAAVQDLADIVKGKA